MKHRRQKTSLTELAQLQDEDADEEEGVVLEEKVQEKVEEKVIPLQQKALDFALSALRRSSRIPSSVAPITELRKQ